MSEARIEVFPDAAAAAEAAAAAIARQLTPTGPRTLLVTGGRGPGGVYDRLAAMDLDWPRVSVTLSDERFVTADSPDSNERLVRERLLQGFAAAARFMPLKGQGPSPEADAATSEPAIRALLPFDAALLGMGEDGHIASLFPSTPGVAGLLDPDGSPLVVGVAAAGLAPHLPRISLTGRALFDSRLIVLLVFGEPKRAVLERTLTDPAFAPPVSLLMRQRRAPVRVLWAP